jgi:hypothetical protein
MLMVASCVADFDAFFVFAVVELGVDLQAGAGCGV